MTDHTAEPWQIIRSQKGTFIIGSKRSIARVWGAIQPDDRPSHEEADANAARIVACVNACAGIPTEQLGDVARLVAAAEKLLAAQEAEALWDQDGKPRDNPPPSSDAELELNEALDTFQKD